MDGERILIVDDDPMSIKLMRALLEAVGYVVRSAESAEEALAVLKTFDPRLILMDIQLPGVDGWGLASRLRKDPAMDKTCIVILTAYSMEGDEHKSRNAGCNGYITKPIDVRTLPSLVSAFLKEENSQERLPSNGDNEDLLAELRNNLLAEGMDQLPALLINLENEFNVDTARRFFHRWAGIAGTLGYSEITRQARKLEALFTYPVNETKGALRTGMHELMACFSAATMTNEPKCGWPPEIVACLSGKRFGLIGFSRAETRRITHALQQVQGTTQGFVEALPGAAVLAVFDLLLVKLSSSVSNAWTDAGELGNNDKPLLLVGPCKTLLAASSPGEQQPDFLTAPWDADEVILRAYRLLSRSRAKRVASGRRPGVVMPIVVVADDDFAVTSLVSAALQQFQIDCRVAPDGAQGLQMVRDLRPRALVLDINMPGMDGFDVLVRMRMDTRTRDIPVILLSARRQEDDVMRGFGYGAADYVMKPFNPTELAARVSRLID